jgi:hypothetical protein
LTDEENTTDTNESEEEIQNKLDTAIVDEKDIHDFEPNDNNMKQNDSYIEEEQSIDKDVKQGDNDEVFEAKDGKTESEQDTPKSIEKDRVDGTMNKRDAEHVLTMKVVKMWQMRKQNQVKQKRKYRTD